MIRKYDFKAIEAKWQKYWLENKTFKTTEDDNKPYFYALDMFAYPSGAGLHVGHPAGYTANDIIARLKLMQGYNVLHPFGWDSFGLPAEQYAIKTGNHPGDFTKNNIAYFKKQIQKLGYSYDWDKEISTSDPSYYKWTQWIFKKMYEEGVAEQKMVEVNWCEEFGTTLANDEITKDDNGNIISERGGHPVTKKPLLQWVLKTTKYANRLFDMSKLDWVASTKKMHKNFIKDPASGKINLHDWTFSRQRYWGEPFPITHNQDGTLSVLPDNKLPLILPNIKNFKPKDGKPALANSQKWIEAGYDLNTMPGAAGSSWYQLAYILKDENGYLPIDSKKAKEKFKKWMPVDSYIGGTEHTTGHLLYARFYQMFLTDIGILDKSIEEPFKKLIHQGMILGPDGKKMSKSKGNVINPDDVIEKYGADTLRAYITFMGAFEDVKPWSEKGLSSIHKWLNKVWKTIISTECKEDVDNNLKSQYSLTIKNVEENIEKAKFNVAISDLMVFINSVIKHKVISKKMQKGFLQALNLFCPHISEELWELLGFKERISTHTWPIYDKTLIATQTCTLVIQIDGKTKSTIKLPKGLNEKEVKEIIENLNKYKQTFNKAKHIVYIKDEVFNIITK